MFINLVKCSWLCLSMSRVSVGGWRQVEGQFQQLGQVNSWKLAFDRSSLPQTRPFPQPHLQTIEPPHQSIKPTHLQPVSHIISHQWAITSPTREPCHLLIFKPLRHLISKPMSLLTSQSMSLLASNHVSHLTFKQWVIPSSVKWATLLYLHTNEPLSFQTNDQPHRQTNESHCTRQMSHLISKDMNHLISRPMSQLSLSQWATLSPDQ